MEEQDLQFINFTINEILTANDELKRAIVAYEDLIRRGRGNVREHEKIIRKYKKRLATNYEDLDHYLHLRRDKLRRLYMTSV